ncbi:cytochrome P450 [Streptomyces sp. NPDC007929]|uniref:cytochrome P450 n=1 Tax=unclassified Streptomyces TaxID=2593676 RepID=UPI0036EDB862
MQHDAPAKTPVRCPAHRNVPLFGPEFGADPQRHYDQLRRMGPSAPVDIAPDVEVELVTSYDAALSILQNPAWFARDSRLWNALNEGRVPRDSPAVPMMGHRPNALFADGAAHARLRQAITDSLATIEEIRLVRLVQRSADYLVSRFADEPHGRAELMADYAQPLPLLVFSDLFGCPPEIGDHVIAGISGIFEGAPGADEELGGALSDLIALKHLRPGADLTTRLLNHSARLSDEEVLHQLVTLLSGGTLPLAATIGTSTALYLDADWPAGLPVEDAIMRTLWHYAPIANYAAHYPRRDVELGGRTLRAGDPVLISFAGANTDPKLTEHREQLSAKSHLAFGAGPHACPAKDPAFLIAVHAVESLLNRLPDVMMAASLDELGWAPTPWIRSPASLPVRFTPRTVPSATEREVSGARTVPGGSGFPAGRPGGSGFPAGRVDLASAPRVTASAPHHGKGLFSRFLAWARGN